MTPDPASEPHARRDAPDATRSRRPDAGDAHGHDRGHERDGQRRGSGARPATSGRPAARTADDDPQAGMQPTTTGPARARVATDATPAAASRSRSARALAIASAAPATTAIGTRTANEPAAASPVAPSQP